MDQADVVRTFDYQGLPCPMPVVRISQDIISVGVGEVVEVLTTDPGSLSDFPAWARATGHEVIETRQQDVIHILLRRTR